MVGWNILSFCSIVQEIVQREMCQFFIWKYDYEYPNHQLQNIHFYNLCAAHKLWQFM